MKKVKWLEVGYLSKQQSQEVKEVGYLSMQQSQEVK
jgi:hypothetical protein